MSDALRAENARLREECDRYKAMYENIHVTAAELRRVRREWKRDREQNAELHRENAELQENLESARKTMADELEKQVSDYRARHIEQAGVIADLDEENAKLRETVATAIRVQAVLCEDADSLYCRNECPLHRPESNDCLACDVIRVAQELGIEVDG